jgi:hypothetical protein
MMTASAAGRWGSWSVASSTVFPRVCNVLTMHSSKMVGRKGEKRKKKKMKKKKKKAGE